MKEMLKIPFQKIWVWTPYSMSLLANIVVQYCNIVVQSVECSSCIQFSGVTVQLMGKCSL